MKRQLIAFVLGIAFGLILALWWRAAQIRQAGQDAQIIGITTGMSPE